jgi:putative DNA primase/helicase
MKHTRASARRQLVSPESNGRHPPQSKALSEDAHDFLAGFTLLWPTSEDATAAAQAAELITCATATAVEHIARDRDIIVVEQDHDDGAKAAHELVTQCLKHKAKRVGRWRLPGFGSRHPTMREWCTHNDLVEVLEAEHARKWGGFVGFVGTLDQVPPDFSGVEIRPIAVDLMPVPALEDCMIPDPLRAWILDIARRAWIPPEYAAVAAIVGLSGLIGRRIVIRPKRHDRWLVVPNLWGAGVGLPGVLKTPQVEEALRPLKRLAADGMERHKEELAAHAERQLVAAARKDAAKNELKAKARKGADDAILRELAREASAEHDEAPPTARRYLVNDTTLEKLGVLLAENPNGLTLFRDELTGFLRSFDRQGHESDRSFYLEAWSGLGSFTFDRIERGTTYLPSVCLAIFGTVQPGPLAKYLRGSLSGEEADGFVPRFQLLVHPDPYLKYLYVDQAPNIDAKNAAYAVFQALDLLDAAAKGCSVDEDTGIPFIGFDDDAQAFFVEWYTALEERLKSGTLSNIMASHLAKYRSLMPSLSLIFHLVATCAEPQIPPVSLRAAELAAAWCQLLEAHARRIYQAAADGDPEDAIRLAEKIQQSLPNPCTYRQIAQKGWAGLSTVEEVRKAVGILEDRGVVKVVEVPTDSLRGGRPSEKIWFNPQFLAQSKGVDA